MSAGTADITAVFAGVTASTAASVSAATLSVLEITPVNPTVVKGMSVQFTATGIFSDDSVQNLTNDVTWYSDKSNVVVSNIAGSKGQAFFVETSNVHVGARYVELVSF